jgi:hypothetical protein
MRPQERKTWDNRSDIPDAQRHPNDLVLPSTSLLNMLPSQSVPTTNNMKYTANTPGLVKSASDKVSKLILGWNSTAHRAWPIVNEVDMRKLQLLCPVHLSRVAGPSTEYGELRASSLPSILRME